MTREAVRTSGDMLKVFSEFSHEELDGVFGCLRAHRRSFEAGETLMREGEPSRSFGILLSGAVDIKRYGIDGRVRLLVRLTAGEAFGTSFVLGGADRAFANVEASERSEALFLDGSRVLNPCSRACPAHVRLLSRLLAMLAHRNTALARKIDCLTQRTTAEKLLAYLRQTAGVRKDQPFEIPFSRQQLADYLNVDRSALSTEISRLVKAGRIEAERRRFRLLAERPA